MLEPKDRPLTTSTTKQPTVKRFFSLLILSAIGSGSIGYLAAKQPDPTAIAPASANPTTVAANPASINTNFITQVVDRAGPAVVRIDSSKKVATRQLPPEFDTPRLRRYFGFDDRTGSNSEREVENGTGSGFIINSNGQILTNAHVIKGADKVNVTLKDGRTLEGKVVGLDRMSDVAVIKIQADNLPTIPLGNSNNLKPGEWAIAIGNPLGLDNTVTTGIISGTGRSSNQIGAGDTRVNYIQTDAAINPGNSGGPLLNANGQAIGMNTAILRNSQGLGFAIPINTAQKIANKLIATGKYDRPFLGIQMDRITPRLKEEINKDAEAGIKIDADKGVIVMRVLQSSPAEKAGMKAGDTISSINGKAVATPSEVQQIVEDVNIGSSIAVRVRRNGRELTLNVSPTAAPQSTTEKQ
jgi:S1-C subfamily serine protease